MVLPSKLFSENNLGTASKIIYLAMEIHVLDGRFDVAEFNTNYFYVLLRMNTLYFKHKVTSVGSANYNTSNNLDEVQTTFNLQEEGSASYWDVDHLFNAVPAAPSDLTYYVIRMHRNSLMNHYEVSYLFNWASSTNACKVDYAHDFAESDIFQFGGEVAGNSFDRLLLIYEYNYLEVTLGN